MEKLPKIWKKFGRPLETEKARTVQQVTCFGFADAKPSDKVYQDAFKVAFVLAQAGYTIVDGGGPGVMEAASQGAKAAGGTVIGVTFYPKDANHFEGRDRNNPLDKEIKTNNYLERTMTLLREGQVYVVFNGATGTLSEFAMAWGLARLYLGHHKPLILYGSYWKNIVKALQKNMLIRPDEMRVFKIVDSPQKVLDAINKFEKEIEQGRHRYMAISKEEGAFTL